MKPGSLVECVVNITIDQIKPEYKSLIKQLPVKNKIYIVREISKCDVYNVDVLYLEEIILGYNDINQELGFLPIHFRELILPPSFEAELEEVILASECIC